VIAKLTDDRMVDRGLFERRIETVVELARQSDQVVGPVLRNGAYVDRIGGWLAVVYPFVYGRAPRLDRDGDILMMGRALAELHRSMAKVPTFGLRGVAALELAKLEPPGSPVGRGQLIHGDFAVANLRLRARRLRVLDFDDCGLGPVEYDLGNSLYMVLFDTTINGNPAGYDHVRRLFVDSYRAECGRPVDDSILEAIIDHRRSALRHWLDNPDEAPIGIKTSSPEWRTRLRLFVDPVVPTHLADLTSSGDRPSSAVWGRRRLQKSRK
jgi:Ser/Thr protein kinase RdoA (MazF antagonist)